MSLGVSASLSSLPWLLSSTPTPPDEAPRKVEPFQQWQPNEPGHGTVKERTERWFLKRLASFVRASQPLGEAVRALTADCQPFLSDVK